MSWMHRAVLVVMVALAGLHAGPAAAAPFRYRLTVIEPVGEDESTIAVAVNNRGEVAITGVGTESRIYSWKSGVTTPFETVGDGNNAADINEGGWIVSGGTPAGFTLYKRGREPFRSPPFDSVEGARATAVNNAGDVVGIIGRLPDVIGWFLYSGGELTQRFCCRANDISNRGRIVGSVDVPDPLADWTQHAAILGRDGSVTDIHPDPAERYSTATAVNDNDEIVGFTGVPRRAFKVKAGRVQWLGEFEPSDINNAGTIVGWRDIAAGRPRAVVRHGRLTYDLNGLTNRRGKFELSQALGINDRGWIVGVGRYWGSGLYPNRAFLLRPVPPVAEQEKGD